MKIGGKGNELGVYCKNLGVKDGNLVKDGVCLEWKGREEDETFEGKN